MPVLVSVAASPLTPQVMADMEKVYADSPEFASGAAAAQVLAEATQAGETLYLGVFNGHNISSVLVRGENDSRHMRFLCVHHATRGRGVAERLVAEVRRIEQERGVRWLEADFDLSQEGVSEMLLDLGFIPHADTRCYRALIASD
jgi:ribosomal protein S18 acetylase RimI-like enzyme